MHSLKDCHFVSDIRNSGLAAGFTLAAAPGEPLKRPYQVAMSMWQKGFYVRYGGDCIAIAPAFTVEQAEIDSLVNALGESFNELS